MSDYYVSAFCKSAKEAVATFNSLIQDYPGKPFEVWSIKEDRFGNKFVVICREKTRGTPPNIVLLNQLMVHVELKK